VGGLILALDFRDAKRTRYARAFDCIDWRILIGPRTPRPIGSAAKQAAPQTEGIVLW
jgi:hypothetical protein